MSRFELHRLAMGRIQIGLTPGLHPVFQQFSRKWAIFPYKLFQGLHHSFVIGPRRIGSASGKDPAVRGAKRLRPLSRRKHTAFRKRKGQPQGLRLPWLIEHRLMVMAREGRKWREWFCIRRRQDNFPKDRDGQDACTLLRATGQTP